MSWSDDQCFLSGQSNANLQYLDEEGRLAGEDAVGRAEPRENAIGRRERARLGRHEAAELRLRREVGGTINRSVDRRTVEGRFARRRRRVVPANNSKTVTARRFNALKGRERTDTRTPRRHRKEKKENKPN